MCFPRSSDVGMDAPKELPLKLVNGHAGFNGTVSGALDDPRVFRGRRA